jgi:hypothetical protein
MNPLYTRYALFLGGCIPTRLLLAYLAYKLPEPLLPFLGIIGAAIGTGLLFLYFTGLRKTGVETLGAPIWWRPYRWLHGILYLLFAYFMFTRQRIGWLVVFLDTVIGLALFLLHHLGALTL